MTDRNREILRLSAQIVAAHVGNNDVKSDALKGVIASVYNTLHELGEVRPHVSVELDHSLHDHFHANNDHDVHHPHTHAPDAYVHPVYGQTVFEDRLVCMEDGLSMKMLKRHLLTVHGMTPDEYRAKWNLPSDYPMVAAQYAKLRSSLALETGLGLKPKDRPTRSRGAKRG
ncbi:MAG TPA: MucR family transcriptional regulator [Rhodopila sp.]|nr:MucR family transcriptional regulator [Rhodopila sp.]